MEVVLDAVNGRALTLSELSVPREGERVYLATLSTEAGAMSMSVSDYGDLAAFFRDVAESWTGVSEAKEYSTLETGLDLSCRHDGAGTVICTVTLTRTWPSMWKVSADLSFGGGAHLDRIATDLANVFEAAA